MNSIDELLARLVAQDIRLTLAGDRLGISAPKDALTPELRAELAGHKEALKQYLRARVATSGPAADLENIPKIERLPVMPASHTQQRLWFLQQLDPGNSAYNIPSTFTLRGRLDQRALENTLADLLARHESLRTGFTDDDGLPGCIVEPGARIALERFDLSHLPASEHAAHARRVIIEFSSSPFDLRQAPLMRAALVTLAEKHWIFCIVVHHIIADGLSLAVLGADFQTLYRSRALHLQSDLPPLPVQYIDYVDWERRWRASGVLQQQLAFWKKELSDAPVIELPTDRPRPRLQSWSGAGASTVLTAQLTEALRALARAERATLFMVMLAGFQTLLHRYTSQTDLPVGTAVANRRRPEVEHVVGFFANNIVLRGRLDGDPSVRELLGRVRDTALNAFSHQDMPFDQLVNELVTRRDLERSPLFQVLFVLTGVNQSQPQLTALDVEPLQLDSNTARFDLSVDVFDAPQGLQIYFGYNTDLFEQATVERMIEHYRLLLQGFVADPSTRLSALPLLGIDERQQVLAGWNRTALAYPHEAAVATLFAEQAAATPSSVALECGSQRLTYQQLDERSSRLASYLRARGVVPEQLVGLCVHRSLDMVIAQLAILKAGGAYVPLDPALPADRIDFMVQDAALSLIVTDASLAPRFLQHGLQIVRVDADAELIERCGTADALPAVRADRLAYVIYTSGSTGKPKGVQIEHRSVVNLLRAMQHSPGICQNDRLLAVTTLSFDIAGLEILGPLTCGATVTLADRDTTQDGYALARLIETSGATIMQATPATWRLLLECDWSGCQRLKLLCGGESLPRELADRLLPRCKELWNMYGPTETTIWSTAGRVEHSAEYPGIGRPIANTQVYVLDHARRPVPVGVPGELYIGGDGLARGYLRQPELTAERFVTDELSGRTGARLYRTGDLARWRPDGTLHCLGRVDQQLKIRGYRVEPAEIEAALVAIPDIAQAVVLARQDSSGTATLIAYVVAGDPSSADPARLRGLLRTQLPEYMIPKAFVNLERLPLTPNGKIDRKSLPEPAPQLADVVPEPAGYANRNEQLIAAIWQEVLGVASVSRHDNFFDLGGHSLLIVRVQKRLQQELNTQLPIIELFQHTTIAALAAHLADSGAAEDQYAVARDRALRRKSALAKETVA